MEVIQLTKELTKKIQDTDLYAQFHIAQQTYKNDEHLQNLIKEFHKLKRSISKEISEKEKNDIKISKLNEQMNLLYNEITNNPIMIAFDNAKNEINNLIQKINYIINSGINGKDPMEIKECDIKISLVGGCGSCNSSCSK